MAFSVGDQVKPKHNAFSEGIGIGVVKHVTLDADWGNKYSVEFPWCMPHGCPITHCPDPDCIAWRCIYTEDELSAVA